MLSSYLCLLPLDFADLQLSTVGIHAFIQFVVVDTKFWFLIFYYISYLMNALCIIFNTWTLQMVKVVSEAFLFWDVFWLSVHCFLLHLTNPWFHLRYTGMNGLDLCVVECKNRRLYGLTWFFFFRHRSVPPLGAIASTLLCQLLIYLSVNNLLIWLFATPLNVNCYICTHSHGLEVFKFMKVRLLILRSWWLLSYVGCYGFCIVMSHSENWWLLFNCFWFSFSNKKTQAALGRPCLWHLCKYATFTVFFLGVKIHLLSGRDITTLKAYNWRTEKWNIFTQGF